MFLNPPSPVTHCHTFLDPIPLERDILHGRPPSKHVTCIHKLIKYNHQSISSLIYHFFKNFKNILSELTLESFAIFGLLDVSMIAVHGYY